MDGAGRIQTFRYNTLPLLRPAIITVVMIRMISAFLAYDLVYVLTQGGAGTATETISFYIARITFRHLDLGYASALSWVLLGAVVGLVALSLVVGGRTEE